MEQIDENNLIDIWRYLHPNDTQFTWQKFNHNQQGRLDYFLISSSLLPFVVSSGILPSFRTDHSGIELVIDFSKFTRGRGFWKFNCSLLHDPIYVSKVKNTIKRVKLRKVYYLIWGIERSMKAFHRFLY